MNKQLSQFIKAISEPNRLKLLSLLKTEQCVCQLWQKLKLPQNLTSHHLKVLKEAGLISSKKQGVKIIYKLNRAILKSDLKSLTDFLN